MSDKSEQTKNDILLTGLRDLIFSVRNKIKDDLTQTEKTYKNLTTKRSPTPTEEDLIRHTKKRASELEVIYGAPFFTKVVLTSQNENAQKTLFFSKYQFSSEQIFSWVSPIASIRFENPGAVTYKLPNGQTKNTQLIDKEQYMIVDGKVIFFAKETIDTPRKLIYHDYFSSQKGTFELPEIVAIMEKAQDEVIRAHHVGAFAISGPAGSGKTTLALHRIAFLLQSPDTLELYSEKSVVVFVQDQKAKEYFSHLLPNLGINEVKIVTFFEWATEILQLSDVQFCLEFGNTESEKGLYEFEKIKILRTLSSEKFNKNIFLLLEKIYTEKLPKKYSELFSEQKKQKILDRIDLTIALILFEKVFGKLEFFREYNVFDKNGELKTKKEKKDVEYSLILVDEFQNYLPEQLTLLNNCIKKETKSMIYVGDINQQVKLGTIRSFDQIEGEMSEKRNITLHKVYRNTRQILEYIQTLGYAVEIPDGIKNGHDVVEKYFNSRIEITENLQYILKNNPEKTVGILTKNTDFAKFLKDALPTDKLIHISTIFESQGIEFDIVCLIGEWKSFYYQNGSSDPLEYCEEKRRIDKDLLYIGLTRAREEMYVFGDSLLSEHREK